MIVGLIVAIVVLVIMLVASFQVYEGEQLRREAAERNAEQWEKRCNYWFGRNKQSEAFQVKLRDRLKKFGLYEE